MKAAYSDEGFRELSFTFGIDYESIPGKTKRTKMISFIDDAYRHNRLEVLANFLEGDRPEHDWNLSE